MTKEETPQTQDNNDDALFRPDWISDTEIDPRWIEAKAQLSNVERCTVQDISNDTRKGDKIRNGATLKLFVTFTTTSEPLSLVIKQVPDSGRPLSGQLGLAREALFYDHLAPQVKIDNDNATIPKIYYTQGNMTTGAKIVIMEDLSADFLDSGILFGPGNPNNWNRNLQERIEQAYGKEATPPSSAEVAKQTFLAIAKVHATFWKDSNLLQYSWLRGSQWIQAKEEESWKASQGLIQGIWNSLDGETLDQRIQWDPLVKSTLTKAIQGISWEAQLKRLNTTTSSSHWTLVHGDFWPGNVFVSTTETASELRLVDWEMTGLGSGPQDLGQYILSNMDPSERRVCEEELVRAYYNQLTACGGDKVDITWEECWMEYKVGGIERWLWFLAYFLGQEGPLLKWAQFFHNQIAAFLHDHQLGPDSVVQPRP